MNNLKDNLGKQGTDVITGFNGTITGVIEYMYGCEQYYIIPKMKKDGTRPGGEWFDIARIKISGKKVSLEKVEAGVKGAEFNNEKYPSNGQTSNSAQQAIVGSNPDFNYKGVQNEEDD